MSMIKCPECGHSVSTNAPACPECGVRIQGNIMKCPECGEIILCGQPQCPHCHFSLANVPQAMPTEEQVVVLPKKKKSRVWPWLLAVLALVVIGGCVYYYFLQDNVLRQEIKDYKRLEGVTDPKAYENFLSEYPNSEYTDDVQQRLKLIQGENNDWNAVASSRFSSDYETFMSNHPNSVHIRECMTKIDSLDWLGASQENTVEAIEQYLTKHPDGRYTEEANAQKAQFAKLDVTPADESMVRNIFANYFSSLSNQDEGGVCATIAPVLTNFFTKQNATKNDVLNYMHRLFSDDVLGLHFTINNDYKVVKSQLEDGSYLFNVGFTVDQAVKTDEADNVTTYRVSAGVTTDGKISNISMSLVR